MKAAAIYARVSTVEQADNGTSLESQVAACQRYAETNGYTVVATYEESKSGASLDRPKLDKIRESARKGEIDAVIFYALDRLSRDETDMLILAREWRIKGVEMRCATVPIEDSPQGQFLLTMLAAVGKLERAGILERTLRGKRQTVRNGRVLKAKSDVFGYAYQDGRYERYEPEALWVRRMYQWYCEEGLSLLMIAYRLAEARVPTKQGGKWAPATVRHMLTNEVYTGEYWWNKNRPRSEWVGPVPIPPIIDRETYDAALARVEYNKRNCKRRCSTEYLLRGLIVCEVCGRRLAGDKKVIKTGTHTYYACTNKQAATAPEERCTAARVNGRKAEEKAWDWVITHLNNPQFFMELLEGADEDGRAQRDRDDADMGALLGLRVELEREENKLIELFTNDAITLDKFRERNQHLEERRAGVEQSIAEIDGRRQARAQAVDDIKHALDICRAVQRGLPKLSEVLTFEEKRQVLEALHIKATARANGDIHITGLISEDLLGLATPADEGIMGHDLHSDRGSDRGWQDDANQDSGRAPEYAGAFGGDRHGQRKASAWQFLQR